MLQPLPEPHDYEQRVQAYEAQGMTRSDAQGVVDAEEMKKARNINKLIEVLQLEPINGKYKTAWGNKTLEGLKETIKNIINE